jgi:hypothetical protein
MRTPRFVPSAVAALIATAVAAVGAGAAGAVTPVNGGDVGPEVELELLGLQRNPSVSNGVIAFGASHRLKTQPTSGSTCPRQTRASG